MQNNYGKTTNDRKTNIYVKGGAKGLYVYEEVKLDWEKYPQWSGIYFAEELAVGGYLGAGVETRILGNLSGIAEVEVNKVNSQMYGRDFDLSGTKLVAGLRYNFNFSE